MHKELKDLLHAAEGQSQHVVVVFLDVRGFSSFAGIAESTDTAEFLKTVYLSILDNYFTDTDFFKLTGDGMLLLLGYDRERLTDVVRYAVDTSLRLIEGFPTISEGDDMVNFDVPSKLGIGLARGSATSLTANGKVLDYSGRPLNLASRLMDLARPSGIVFDDSFGFTLLDDAAKERFFEDSAYVKGLAESKPMKVFCLKGYTEIPEFNRKPMDGFTRFTEEAEALTFREMEERAPFFRHQLTKEPARVDNIELHLSYPAMKSDGRKHPSMQKVKSLPATYGTAAGASYAVVDYAGPVAELKEFGVKKPWKVTAVLEYSVAE